MKKILLTTGLLSVLTLAGCSNPSNSEPTVSSTTASSVASTRSSSSSTAASSAQATAGLTGLAVSTKDAIQRYQETFPNTDITAISLEQKLGNPIYKIEGVDDTKEYELNLNAQSNEIVQQRDENLDRDDRNERQEDALQIDNLLSVDEVAEIAHKQAAGTIEEFDLIKDLGTTYWEVKLKEGRRKTELKINAQTGDILEQEHDD